MAGNLKWFDRRFELEMNPEKFPEIICRMRGTAVRLRDCLEGIPSEKLTRCVDDKWSIQENAGHLLDLEPLWAARLDDLLAGAQNLRPTDLNNSKTHFANHNARSMNEILVEFGDNRSALVARLDKLTSAQLALHSIHPRLQLPMTVVDLSFFVAEHDDHHLSRISKLLQES